MKNYLTSLCVFLCLSVLLSCNRNNAGQETEKKIYAWNEFSMGVDLSYVNQVQEYGGIYKENNTEKDPFLILKEKGANTVRVRLWHTPTWTAGLNNGKMYCDLYDAEKTIRRAKQLGMAVSLDFHYSDRWADPAHQDTPAAWSGLVLSVLKDSLYNYTLSVLNYLKSKDLVPEMVQIGNETNNGMCWPVGKAENNNFENFAELLNSGIKAVRDFSQTSAIKPKIILHEAQLQTANWWMQHLYTRNVTDFDIIGLSHYAKWSDVKTMQGVTDSLKALKTRFGKPVMIVETAYPWTGANADTYNNIFSAADTAQGYGISLDEHLRYMKDLVQAVINAGGIGVQYWEPAWITSSLNDGWGIGSAWENNAFFDFHGNVLPITGYMTFKYKF